MTSRQRLLILAGAVVAVVLAGWLWASTGGASEPIRVGILHSQTGPMAISESSAIDAEVLALEEINAAGGLAGRPVEWVIADGRSDWPTYAREAERLITEEHVSVIFGCWTSASRKNVKPVVERHNHLLFYPMAYEGMEQSANIVYTGAAPNQQIIPTVEWSYDHLGARRFYLVGSDYVWPHSINAIIKDQLTALGAELAGEGYVFFGSSEVGHVVDEIRRLRPDVILSSVVGDSNLAFYQALRQAGIRPATTPVISFSISENELAKLSPAEMAGNYATWNYFQSIDRRENHEFVRRFQARYGEDRVTSDVIAAAYNSVRLWAQAVQESGTEEVSVVRERIRRQSLNAPEGVVSVDEATNHTWRPVYIGKMRPDGQFDIVWTSQKPVRPVPYPLTRSRSEWEDFLDGLFSQWGGSWANPVEQRATSDKTG